MMMAQGVEWSVTHPCPHASREIISPEPEPPKLDPLVQILVNLLRVLEVAEVLLPQLYC